MKPTPVTDPVSGEKLIDMRPELALYPKTAWKRRLNHFTGRTLTHSALTNEQDWLNGQMSAVSRVASAGVIEGLSIQSHLVVESDTTFSNLYIAAGSAITRAGESIKVNRDTTCPVPNLLVFRHELHPEIMTGENLEETTYAEQLPTLNELTTEDPAAIARAGILVLEPVFAELRQQDSSDLCPPDPSDYAFEKWQLIDACRVVLYTWPEDWITMPATGEGWRNRLAQAIYSKERELTSGEFHPWEAVGVPIGLVGFDASFQVDFIDIHAVRRQGGRIGINGNGLAGEGNPLLWQAQYEQFNAQLAQLAASGISVSELLEQIPENFRYLPPVGVLPKPFAKPRDNDQTFFPHFYSVRARAIPMEQLDVAVRESQPLLPFDLQSFDDVELLVPIPQNFYDPNLLEIEAIDPSFDVTIQRFTIALNEWLGRRHDVQQKTATLYEAIKGERLKIEKDRDRLDDLELPFPQQTALIELGNPWRVLQANAAPNNWQQLNFNDANFESLPSGWGYGKGDYETELSQMRGRYNTCFVRRDFQLEEAQLNNRFELIVDTNARFRVFLNGTEIFRHAPTNLSYSLTREKLRPQLIRFEFMDEALALLTTGDNLLAIAIQPLSEAIDSFYFSPRLTQTISQSQFQPLDIGEEAYGLTLDLEDSEADAIEPAYLVDELETLKNDFRSASPRLIRDEDITTLEEDGLQSFIALLERKIASANDIIDFGFTRIRTEIYRIDQYIMGNKEGTKLATSPILASIANSQSASSTLKELNAFFDGLKAGEQSGDGGGDGNDPSPAAGDNVVVAGDDAGNVRAPSRNLAETPTRDLYVSGLLSTPTSRSVSMQPRDGTRFSGTTVVETGSSRNVILSDRGIGESRLADNEDLIFIAAAESGSRPLSKGGNKESSLLFASKGSSIDEVQEQSAIVGATSQYRNVTVGERLEESVAVNSVTFGVSVKADTLSDLKDNADIVLDGINVPGVTNTGNPDEPLDLGNVNNDTIAEVLNFQHDLDPETTSDEAAYFNGTIRALENSSVTLRRVEGRVHSYKRIKVKCEELLKTLKTTLKKVDKRLAEIDEPLAEARHDLSVARSLLKEEQARVEEVNQQRDQLLQKRVPYYVFRRPRFSFTHQETPFRVIYPKADVGLPTCEFSDQETPAEITQLMSVTKRAPIKWFKCVKELEQFNHPSQFYLIAEYVYLNYQTSNSYLQSNSFASEHFNAMTKMLWQAMGSNKQAAKEGRKVFTEKELLKAKQKDWRGAKEDIKERATLADILDSNHGKTKVNKDLAEELERQRKVIACLYHHFSSIEPAIKLLWIEQFSQFDASVPLANLYSLPKWSQIDYLQRRDMQKLVDWLYGRFNLNYPEARGYVDNVIRICILLASDSPVGKLITGAIPKQSSVKPGKSVDIEVPTDKAKVGMEVSIQANGREVAKGKVENVDKKKVTMRVEQTGSGKSGKGRALQELSAGREDASRSSESIRSEKEATELPANARAHIYQGKKGRPASTKNKGSAKVKTKAKSKSSKGRGWAR